jgi:hypothetical protein
MDNHERAMKTYLELQKRKVKRQKKAEMDAEGFKIDTMRKNARRTKGNSGRYRMSKI